MLFQAAIIARYIPITVNVYSADNFSGGVVSSISNEPPFNLLSKVSLVYVDFLFVWILICQLQASYSVK